MRKLTKTLFITVLALIAPACADTSSETSVTGEAEESFCTLIGCIDGVTANWDGALKPHLGKMPYTVEACLDDRCAVATVQMGSEKEPGCTATTDYGTACCNVDPRHEGLGCVVDTGGDVTFLFDLDAKEAEGTPVARLVATDANGLVVFADEERVELRSFKPNGPFCGPTCHQGKVTFGGKD